jgi:pyruvate,water dikinase
MQPPSLVRIRFFYPGLPDEPAAKETLGGKGYSLAAMSRAGLPVPPGFIISTECCRDYLSAGKRWPDGLEEEVRQALGWLERVTERTLGQGPRPLFVAVRSGAAVSMPGMMDTVLNVGLHPGLADAFPVKEAFWSDLRDFVKQYAETVCGLDDRAFADVSSAGGPEAQARKALDAFRAAAGRDFPSDPRVMLSESISAVFRSWHNDRALRYRSHHNIRGLAGTAAVVQAMFPSQRSGILFTEDPNRPGAGRVILEASMGLGEAIVRGHVDPDVFVVDREKLEIRERRPGAASGTCLTDDQALEVVRMGLGVERHFGSPMDIEWGLADGRFVLLQSRPIRGLEVLRALPEIREQEIERLRGLSSGRKRAAWALHNLAETLPAPTPLTWDILGRRFMTDGFVRLYRDLGFVPSERVEREGFLELVAGKIYADLERAAELFFDRFPMEYDPSAGKRAAEMLLERPSRFDVERAGPGFLLKLPYYIFRMFRAGRVMKRVARRGLEDLEKRVLPSFLVEVGKAGSRKLSELPDEAVLSELKDREDWALAKYGPELLKPGFLAAYYHGRLEGTLTQVLGLEEGRALAATLLAGLEGDKTVESNVELYRVAQGDLGLEEYLRTFGHRAVNELELAEPRWKEDPAYLQQRMRQFQGEVRISPAELHERKKEDRRKAEESLSRILMEHSARSLEEEVRADLVAAQRHMPWRETCKHYFLMGVALVREAVEALAHRWDLGRDIYFLHRAELARFPQERGKLLEAVEARRLRWQAFQRLEVPEILKADDLEALGREPEVVPAADGVFTGTGVAAGAGTGPARIVKSPDDAGDLGVGYVLVCPTTDPSWTPLFVHAAGLVVERGGMLSHGAIVARDFGIPAVVLPQATRLIPEGAAVRVDGNRGTVGRVR